MENNSSVFFREIEIQQNDVRSRGVGVRARLVEELYSLLSILNHSEGNGYGHFL